MKSIYSYIIDYFRGSDKRVLLSVTLLTALLVYINYHYRLDDHIRYFDSFWQKFGTRYLVSLAAFGIPYLVTMAWRKQAINPSPAFIVLLLAAPAVFSLKMELSFPLQISKDIFEDRYWNRVIYWPLLMIITTALVRIGWLATDRTKPFYGMRLAGISWKPYFIMLLIMLPLVAAASTQADFLAAYPKLQSVTGESTGSLPLWKKLLFELSYGSDFFTIELFFRGFLVLGFIRWAGPEAILPMACFYCTIHFGKPLGECISSYFGGLLLGIVVYRTRSIFGGLMVHLGIAWMMEAGGYAGLKWLGISR